MPLIDIRHPWPSARLGLWAMTAEEIPAGLESPRQRERWAVQALLAAITGDERLQLGHEASGKPILPGCHVSVSHTRGFAAVLIDELQPVGIDIEYCSDRVEKIAQRFIHPDESAHDILQKLLLWSAKETVYKCFSEDNLLFFDMRLQGIINPEAASCGKVAVMQVANLKRNIVADVRYTHTSDYVLTYTAAATSPAAPARQPDTTACD